MAKQITPAVSYEELEPSHEERSQSVTDQVIADLNERREYGTSIYGTELMTHNGRPALFDAYQEALDLVLYLRQAIMELEVSNIQNQQESSIHRRYGEEDMI